VSRSRQLKFLLLGWSSIGRRRVVPALARLGLTQIDVASLTREVTLPDDVNGRVFRSYADAIGASDADVVYVSTRNSDHAALALQALDAGRHVVVDKPAAIACADVHRLVERAAAQSRLIAEATVWPWHPQVTALLDLARRTAPFIHLTALFGFPPMPADNFRMSAAPGGGMMWDLGAYAVSTARVFFDEAPERVSVAVEHRSGSPLDTAFSVLMQFPGERVLAGRFGMHTGYVNRLIALGPDVEATIDRAFTTVPDQPGTIIGHQGGVPLRIETAAADAFALFLDDVRAAIEARRLDAFTGAMLRDAEALRDLRASAGLG
jgi:NDP-hexose-3-ketoreductase